MKKGIVLPLTLILASVALILGAFFVLNNNPKVTNQKQTLSASPSPTAKTVNTEASRSVYTDEGSANWKTYTNTKYKYSFKYPTNLKISTAVESLPGNESARILDTTCCVNVTDGQFKILLQLNVLEEKRTISQIEDDLEKSFSDKITNINKTKFLNQDALTFTLYGDQKSTTVLKDNYSYEFAVVDQQMAYQILSTFKFTDQPKEGKFCGGIAGIICLSGYECLYDGDYPDAGGKCVEK